MENQTSSGNQSVSQSSSSLTRHVSGRGKTKNKDVWNMKGTETQILREGRPVGEKYDSLIGLLTTLARNCRMCPIHIDDWRFVIKLQGPTLIDEVRKRFLFEDENPCIVNDWILSTLATMRKNYKHELKEKYFHPVFVNIQPEEVEQAKKKLCENCPPDIDKQQWISLVNYWLSHKSQRRSEAGVNNKKKSLEKQTNLHTTGRTSWANLRLQHEEKGQKLGKVDFYIATHTTKRKHDGGVDVEGRGQFINKTTRQSVRALLKIDEKLSQDQPPSREEAEEVAFDEVFGSNKGGFSSRKMHAHRSCASSSNSSQKALEEEVVKLRRTMERYAETVEIYADKIESLTQNFEDMSEKYNRTIQLLEQMVRSQQQTQQASWMSQHNQFNQTWGSSSHMGMGSFNSDPIRPPGGYMHLIQDVNARSPKHPRPTRSSESNSVQGNECAMQEDSFSRGGMTRPRHSESRRNFSYEPNDNGARNFSMQLNEQLRHPGDSSSRGVTSETRERLPGYISNMHKSKSRNG